MEVTYIRSYYNRYTGQAGDDFAYMFNEIRIAKNLKKDAFHYSEKMEYLTITAEKIKAILARATLSNEEYLNSTKYYNHTQRLKELQKNSDALKEDSLSGSLRRFFTFDVGCKFHELYDQIENLTRKIHKFENLMEVALKALTLINTTIQELKPPDLFQQQEALTQWFTQNDNNKKIIQKIMLVGNQNIVLSWLLNIQIEQSERFNLFIKHFTVISKAEEIYKLKKIQIEELEFATRTLMVGPL